MPDFDFLRGKKLPSINQKHRSTQSREAVSQQARPRGAAAGSPAPSPDRGLSPVTEMQTNGPEASRALLPPGRHMLLRSREALGQGSRGRDHSQGARSDTACKTLSGSRCVYFQKYVARPFTCTAEGLLFSENTLVLSTATRPRAPACDDRASRRPRRRRRENCVCPGRHRHRPSM